MTKKAAEDRYAQPLFIFGFRLAPAARFEQFFLLDFSLIFC
jgi:hypothetical protein